MLPHADDLQPPFGQDFRHDGDDLRGTDVQSDDQVFLVFDLAHAYSLFRQSCQAACFWALSPASTGFPDSIRTANPLE